MARKSGAPKVKITHAMIEAGEAIIRACGVCPPVADATWEEEVAVSVYRAMEFARCPKLNRLPLRNRAK